MLLAAIVLPLLVSPQRPGPTPAQAYIPNSNLNKSVEGSLSPAGATTTTEEAYYDTSVSGSDTDEYVKVVGGVVTTETAFWGTSRSLSIGADSLLAGEISASTFVFTAHSVDTDATQTYTYSRKARNFSTENLPYPIVCVDRYKILDTEPSQAPSVSDRHKLYDSNVVKLSKMVYVNKKTP